MVKRKVKRRSGVPPTLTVGGGHYNPVEDGEALTVSTIAQGGTGTSVLSDWEESYSELSSSETASTAFDELGESTGFAFHRSRKHGPLSEGTSKARKTTPLFDVMEEGNWKSVLTFLRSGTFGASSGRAKSKMAKPIDQVRTWVSMYREDNRLLWRQLPLHYALSKQAPMDVIEMLLRLYPLAVETPDSEGNLPLHHAMKNIFSNKIIELIFQEYPDAIETVNGQGLLPLECINIIHGEEAGQRGKVLQNYLHYVKSIAFEDIPPLKDELLAVNKTIEAAKSELRLAKVELNFIKEQEKMKAQRKEEEEIRMKTELQQLRSELETLRTEREKLSAEKEHLSQKCLQRLEAGDSRGNNTRTSWIATEYNQMALELESSTRLVKERYGGKQKHVGSSELENSVVSSPRSDHSSLKNTSSVEEERSDMEEGVSGASPKQQHIKKPKSYNENEDTSVSAASLSKDEDEDTQIYWMKPENEDPSVGATSSANKNERVKGGSRNQTQLEVSADSIASVITNATEPNKGKKNRAALIEDDLGSSSEKGAVHGPLSTIKATTSEGTSEEVSGRPVLEARDASSTISGEQSSMPKHADKDTAQRMDTSNNVSKCGDWVTVGGGQISQEDDARCDLPNPVRNKATPRTDNTEEGLSYTQQPGLRKNNSSANSLSKKETTPSNPGSAQHTNPSEGGESGMGTFEKSKKSRKQPQSITREVIPSSSSSSNEADGSPPPSPTSASPSVKAVASRDTAEQKGKRREKKHNPRSAKHANPSEGAIPSTGTFEKADKSRKQTQSITREVVPSSSSSSSKDVACSPPPSPTSGSPSMRAVASTDTTEQKGKRREKKHSQPKGKGGVFSSKEETAQNHPPSPIRENMNRSKNDKKPDPSMMKDSEWSPRKLAVHKLSTGGRDSCVDCGMESEENKEVASYKKRSQRDDDDSKPIQNSSGKITTESRNLANEEDDEDRKPIQSSADKIATESHIRANEDTLGDVSVGFGKNAEFPGCNRRSKTPESWTGRSNSKSKSETGSEMQEASSSKLRDDLLLASQESKRFRASKERTIHSQMSSSSGSSTGVNKEEQAKESRATEYDDTARLENSKRHRSTSSANMPISEQRDEMRHNTTSKGSKDNSEVCSGSSSHDEDEITRKWTSQLASKRNKKPSSNREFLSIHLGDMVGKRNQRMRTENVLSSSIDEQDVEKPRNLEFQTSGSKGKPTGNQVPRGWSSSYDGAHKKDKLDKTDRTQSDPHISWGEKRHKKKTWHWRESFSASSDEEEDEQREKKSDCLHSRDSPKSTRRFRHSSVVEGHKDSKANLAVSTDRTKKFEAGAGTTDGLIRKKSEKEPTVTESFDDEDAPRLDNVLSCKVKERLSKLSIPSTRDDDDGLERDSGECNNKDDRDHDTSSREEHCKEDSQVHHDQIQETHSDGKFGQMRPQQQGESLIKQDDRKEVEAEAEEQRISKEEHRYYLDEDHPDFAGLDQYLNDTIGISDCDEHVLSDYEKKLLLDIEDVRYSGELGGSTSDVDLGVAYDRDKGKKGDGTHRQDTSVRSIRSMADDLSGSSDTEEKKQVNSLNNSGHKYQISERDPLVIPENISDEETLVIPEIGALTSIETRDDTFNNEHDDRPGLEVSRSGRVTFADETWVYEEVRDDEFSPEFHEFDDAVDRSLTKITRTTSKLRSATSSANRSPLRRRGSRIQSSNSHHRSGKSSRQRRNRERESKHNGREMNYMTVAGDDNIEILSSGHRGRSLSALELTRSYPAPTSEDDASYQDTDEVKSYTSERSWRTRRGRLNL